MATRAGEGWCPACGAHVRRFADGPAGRPEAACTSCGSLERQRFLSVLLDGLIPYVVTARTVVDIAPSPQITARLRRLVRGRYIRMDFDPGADRRAVDVRASISAMPFPDASVDLLVCFHVLEHVPDDLAGMAEIRRVLSPGGLALVQVPWRPGRQTDEDPSAGVEERRRRFGQADHVRYYGIDFEDRLRAAGLDFVRVTPSETVGPELVARFRLMANEAVWLVRVADAVPAVPLGAPAPADALRMSILAELARVPPEAAGDAVTVRDALRAALAWRVRRARRALRPLRRRVSGLRRPGPAGPPARGPALAAPRPTASPPATLQRSAAMPQRRPHDSTRMSTFEALLGMFPPGRLIDLGAGHGMFSRKAADAGWDVTAVDARAERWEEDPRITWVQKDVREVDLDGYDVVLCLGLFYHLTLDDQLDLLSRCPARTLLLDTHVDTGSSQHTLSERVTVRGFEGRWYHEPDTLLASWGNSDSFWATPESLYRMLGDAGYSLVMAVEPWYLPDRTFFLARRP